jgi:hypothetical protein
MRRTRTRSRRQVRILDARDALRASPVRTIRATASSTNGARRRRAHLEPRRMCRATPRSSRATRQPPISTDADLHDEPQGAASRAWPELPVGWQPRPPAPRPRGSTWRIGARLRRVQPVIADRAPVAGTPGVRGIAATRAFAWTAGPPRFERGTEHRPLSPDPGHARSTRSSREGSRRHRARRSGRPDQPRINTCLSARGRSMRSASECSSNES